MIIPEQIEKDFYKVFENIKKAKSASAIDIHASDYYQLYGLCQNLNVEEIPSINYFTSKKIEEPVTDELVGYVSNVYKHLEYHEKVSNVGNIIPNFYDDNMFQHYIDNYDCVRMALEFLHKYDVLLASELENIINNDNLFFMPYNVEEGLCANTFSFVTLDNTYIIVYNMYCISDVSSLIHEIGHVVTERIINNNRHFLKNPERTFFYSEVYSHFLQFVFILENINYTKYSYDFSTDMKIVMNVLKSSLKQLNNYLRGHNESSVLGDALTDSYGILLALHYAEMYVKDKEKSKFYIKKLIEESFYFDPIDCIDNYGLSKEDIASGRLIKKVLDNINSKSPY